MSLATFREYYQLDAGNAQFKEQANAAELTAGKPTRYFSYTPLNGKSHVGGAFLKFQATLTASAAETPTAGTDLLDLFIGANGSIEVGASSGATSRGKTFTRQFSEFVYAVVSNTNISIAAPPTFAGSGSQPVSVTLFVPLGGPACVLRAILAQSITGVYAANVTISYTQITSYVMSTNWSGVVAFNEERTAALGAGMQSILSYVPSTIAPDAVFMQGESSSTITQVLITTTAGPVLADSSDTDVMELGAAGIAPVAGTTYTTSAGFVIAGNQQAFATFRVNFASATTHYIGYLQVAGGDSSPNPVPAEVGAPAAITQVGTPTATGGVAAAGYGAGAGARPFSMSGASLGGGTAGAIISRRKA